MPGESVVQAELWQGVHVLLDFPHLLILASDRFLDTGFQTVNSDVINDGKPVKDLMLVDNGNVKLVPKLTHQHSSVKGPQIQRVKYAVQLFSGTVAKALTFLRNHGDIYSKNWSPTTNLIQQFSDWFDVLYRLSILTPEILFISNYFITHLAHGNKIVVNDTAIVWEETLYVHRCKKIPANSTNIQES